MVDVQQSALCPLKHHLLSVGDRLIEHDGGVRDKGRDLLSGAGVVLVHLLGIKWLSPEQRVGNRVLLVAGILDVRPQQCGVQ